MKNTVYFSLLFLIVSFSFNAMLHAQEFSNKYDKVTDDEVRMIVYEPDTTAKAVVIYKNGVTAYEFIGGNFRVNYQIEAKIKILKHDGTDYANISIPYYNNEKKPGRKELVSGIEASSYNIEDGKVVKTKMKKEYIFRERLNNNYMQVKFSIPGVKAGTVIEYKYKILSENYYELNSWEIQQDIPVVYSQYELTIPNYFKFNLDTRGIVKTEEKRINQPFTIQYNGKLETIQSEARQLTFTASNLPAVKSDSYIWYPDDYKAHINFELHGLDFPGSTYRSFTSSWENIDELLLKDDDFGKLLKMKNPFQEEMKALSLDGLSTDEKIAKIYTLLKEKVSWNEKYALTASDVRKAVKEGTGSNAVLNFILMSMLRDANIESFPVVMSRRNRGIIPYTHPSINKINTFVVGIQDSDTTMVFADGSITDGYINILPPVLLANRARIIKDSGGEKWIDFSQAGNNTIRTFVKIKITEDGNIEGERNSSYRGQFASALRKSYKAAKDSIDFMEKKESDANIKIIDYQQQGLHTFSPAIIEKYNFTKQVNATDEFIYINPIIFRHITESPFKEETRDLPVEFNYPYTVRISTAITVPENYTVEEIPKPGYITLDDDHISCRYMATQTGNKIILNYIFTLKRIFFLNTEYSLLKDFWEAASTKNNEMIVLKKVTE